MADTLTTLTARVRRYLREPSGTPGSYWDDASITVAINDALCRLNDLALEHGPWFLETTVKQNIVSGTYSYTFPTITGSFIRRVRQLSVYASGDDQTFPARPLQPIELPVGTQASTYPRYTSGIPAFFWFTAQNTVEIRPAPSYSLTNGLVWEVYKAWVPLSSGADAIPTPDLDSYGGLTAQMAALELLTLDEDAPSSRFQVLNSMKEMRLRDYIAFLSRGRRVSPTLIQVRAY